MIENEAIEVSKAFDKAFGRTPLRQRLEDVLGEALELNRYTDLRNLKEEFGDLLCTTLAGIAECGWTPQELIKATLDKIERRSRQYHSLGRKTTVAILGGAFNPVTLDHIRVAQFVLNTSRTFDEVWLMPCFSHLYHKELVSAEQRLEMCRIAAKKDGRIRVSDYEIKHELSGETYQLVKRLQSDPELLSDRFDFSLIIGMDNANTFDKWVNYENLERMIRFVVVPRVGVLRDSKVNWYLKPPHIYLADTDKVIGDGSSTKVREAFKKGLGWDTENLLDQGVYQYIKDHDLYEEKDD